MPPTPHTTPDGAPDGPPPRLALDVNGDRHRLPEGTTVAGLLRELALDGRRIAVAVNREVVPRSAYDTHRLDDGDRVEILEAVGGG